MIRDSVVSVQDGGNQNNPKAVVVATEVRTEAVAVGRTGEALIVVPGPAAQRTAFLAARLDILDIVVFIQTPLPDIAS